MIQLRSVVRWKSDPENSYPATWTVERINLDYTWHGRMVDTARLELRQADGQIRLAMAPVDELEEVVFCTVPGYENHETEAIHPMD